MAMLAKTTAPLAFAWSWPGIDLGIKDFAAKNILAAGLAASACGADVRHFWSPGCRRL